MKKLLLLLCTVLLQVAVFSQTTYLYFENSTSQDFSVNSTQTGSHTMDSDEWWYTTTPVPAWRDETNLLSTNRNSGIHNGTDFYFTTTLTCPDFSVNLKLKLNGNLIGSDIWSAASGPGFSHGWSSDRDFHSSQFTVNEKTYELKYTFYFTGGADDILFTLHEFDPFQADAAELTNPHIINVLAYNTYMLTPPIALSDQGTRAEHIHNAVHDVDAILIQEVFDNSARGTLLANLAAEYPYQTDVVDLPNILEDGGIMIASRWPIEYEQQMVWNDCNNPDCLANKGVMYARINKLGQRYHLFSTHQQAFNGNEDVAVRNLQMQEFNAFIDAQGIPADEAVIFGGDMNVDKHTNKLGEYDNMFTIFNASEPIYHGHSYTWDKNSNHYIGSGEDAPEYLDYVLADNDYLLPDSQSNSVWILRSNHNDMWDIHDLSDHFGVHGRFVYPSAYPCDENMIAFNAGWNMISSNIIPDDPNMLSVFTGMEEDVIIIKDDNGDVVVPSLGINLIGNWDVTKGYKLKASSAQILQMGCTKADPASTPIVLDAGWQIISYLRDDPLDAAAALSGIASNIHIMKDGSGDVYIPLYGINQIGSMLPGKGYQVKMQTADILTYPANTTRAIDLYYTEAVSPVHFNFTGNTGNNATIVIPQGSIEGFEPGDEIGVFNQSDELTGSGTYFDGHMALTVWGDDVSTPEIDHMHQGEPYSFKCYQAATAKVMDLLVEYELGSSLFETDGVAVLRSATMLETKNVALAGTRLSIYPNPAESILNARIFLEVPTKVSIRVYDLSGQLAMTPEIFSLAEGSHLLHIDISRLVHGNYIYRVDTGEKVFNGKFVKM